MRAYRFARLNSVKWKPAFKEDNVLVHVGVLGVDQLILRGGGKNWLVQDFFSHWPVFLFAVKAVQEIFSQIFHPPLPPSKVKWSAP